MRVETGPGCLQGESELLTELREVISQINRHIMPLLPGMFFTTSLNSYYKPQLLGADKFVNYTYLICYNQHPSPGKG